MEKRISFFAIFFGIFAMLVGVYFLLGRYSLTRNNQTQLEYIYSPDGSKKIMPTINTNTDNSASYLQVHFEIQDAEMEEVLFQVQTNASDRMNWSISWIDNKTVLLDSSDIGPYCWKEVDNDLWKEFYCPQ